MNNKKSKTSNSDYFVQREHNCLIKIGELLQNDLPDFCMEFFVGIQNRTSPLTRLNYAYDLRTFFRFATQNLSKFKDYKDAKSFVLNDLNTISAYDVELYLSYLSDYQQPSGKISNNNSAFHTNKERGKARKLSAVKTMFVYFFKRGDLNSDVTAKVDSPKIHDKEIIRLERAEVNELLDTVANGTGLSKRQQVFNKKTFVRDMAITSLFLGTGIRVSELVGINIDDIDFENSSFVVTRKGGNRVVLYLNEEVKQFVREYYDVRTSSILVHPDQKALFLSISYQRLTTRSVENIIKKYAKIATPLKKITPHKLRSTFGTELYRSTGDIYIVADVLGHKDVNTTKKHYAAITEDVRKKAAKYVSLYTEQPNKDDD